MKLAATPESPGVTAPEIGEIVREVRTNNSNHDCEATLALDALVIDEVLTVDTIEFYRLCIEACAFAHRPLWVKRSRTAANRSLRSIGTNG